NQRYTATVPETARLYTAMWSHFKAMSEQVGMKEKPAIEVDSDSSDRSVHASLFPGPEIHREEPMSKPNRRQQQREQLLESMLIAAGEEGYEAVSVRSVLS